MDGIDYQAGKFAKELRVRLLKEHLGLLEDPDAEKMLNDPLDDKLFQTMKSIAKTNTYFYSETFQVYPDDKYLTFNDVIKQQNEVEKEDVDCLLKNYNLIKEYIKGHIVDFPLNFLKEENLSRSFFCRERLVAIQSFL